MIYAPAQTYDYHTPHPPQPHDPFADTSDDEATGHHTPRHSLNRKCAFYNSLPRSFPPDAIHIVLGDFNLALHPTLDSSQPRADQHAARTACLRWLSHLDVVDPWRLQNPTATCYTGPIKGVTRRHRLDYIFLNTRLNSQCYKGSKFHNLHSLTDHLCHSVTLATHQIQRGKGYWRCPKELLDDPKTAAAIIAETDAILPKILTAHNPGVLWDGFMRRTRQVLQRIHLLRSTVKAKAIRQATQRLVAAYHIRHVNQHCQQRFDQAKRLHEDTKAAWKQYQSDLQFDTHRHQQEKSTNNFFRPPNQQLYQVPIGEAICPAYGPTTDPIEVQRIFVDHWEGVFQHDTISRPTPTQRARLVEFLSCQISSQHKESLEADIEISELEAAIKAMAPHKAPGLDGFPAKFFQLAPKTFATILHKIFNYQLARGTLLGRHRKAAVTLLYKNGDRRDPANYRPIALMSVELKILAKTLAYRLSHVLTDIIHDTQKAFVPGRRIHDHIHLLKSIQTHISNSTEDAFATFLDFSKAYDRVDWDFMFDCLHKANFGPIFISWVKLLYTQPMVIILHNNHQSRPVYPTRGVKQGCPLSALLFVLTIEPLSALLRSRPDLGIHIPNFPAFVAALFADDVLLFSKSRDTLIAQLALVQIYCDGSGARLNRSKCTTLYLNDSKPIPTHPDLVMLRTGTHTKYLGLLFGHQLPESTQLHVLDTRLQTAILKWGFRGRTLMGRVLLVKSVVLSILWHFTPVLTIPPTLITRWQAMIRKYVLCRRLTVDDPEYTLLQASYQFDPLLGLGIPHIASCIRYQRLRLLQTLLHTRHDHSQPWAGLAWHQLTLTMGDFHRVDSNDWMFFDKTQKTTVVDDTKAPPHWLDVWEQWSKIPWRHRPAIFDCSQPTLNQAIGMPVWLNAHPWFLCQGPRRLNPLAVVLQSYRPWYSLLAAHGFHCLSDFMPNHFWPPIDAFAQHIDARIGPLPPDIQRPASLLPLYTQLSLFITRIESALSVCLQRPRPRFLLTPFLFPHHTPDQATPTPFHLLKKIHITQLATHYPQPTRPHPMITPHRTNNSAIQTSLRKFKRWYQFTPPTYGNVWYQILLRTLPTNARFPWTQLSDPASIECTYPNCNHPETYRHVLFECPTVAPTWSFHRQAWAPLGVAFTWDHICHPELFKVAPRYNQHKSRLRRLWICLVATLLHTFWHARLATRNDHKPPPHTPYSISGSIDLWATMLRSWLRQTPPQDRPPIRDTITLVSTHPHYQTQWQARPFLLSLTV